MEYEHIVHPIPPLYDGRSRVLILGSFPSRASRQAAFFYGHPRNRFWPLMARLTGEPVPQNVDEKRALALRHGIALWDTIASCDIRGSSDASIVNVVPNDVGAILKAAPVLAVFTNGATSTKLYEKYVYPQTGVPSVPLPSTSPANAAMTADALFEKWSVIAEYLI